MQNRGGSEVRQVFSSIPDHIDTLVVSDFNEDHSPFEPWALRNMIQGLKTRKRPLMLHFRFKSSLFLIPPFMTENTHLYPFISLKQNEGLMSMIACLYLTFKKVPLPLESWIMIASYLTKQPIGRMIFPDTLSSHQRQATQLKHF